MTLFPLLWLVKSLFNPSTFLKNPHVQTILPLFLPTKTGDLYQEEYSFEDGDFTELVWNKKPKQPKNIVILFHGLGGSIHSHYISGMMNTLEEIGFNSVLMHFRGCGIKPNKKARMYHAGEIEDASSLIHHLQKKYPLAKLHAIGYSLGANMLLKLVASFKNKSPLHSAVAISAPLELEKCTRYIDQGFAKIYQHYLLKDLKSSLLNKVKHLDLKTDFDLDEARVKKIKTIYEFDDIFTAPVHGYKNAKEYYTQNSSRQFLKEIKIPTLLIHSKDDPFMPSSVFPEPDEISNSILYEVGNYGGHVGFIEGTLFKPEFWLEKRVKSFFIQDNTDNH